VNLKQQFLNLTNRDRAVPISSQEMAEMQRVASALDAQVGNSSFSQALANDPYGFKNNIMLNVKGRY
jgi:hypothetical protein